MKIQVEDDNGTTMTFGDVVRFPDESVDTLAGVLMNDDTLVYLGKSGQGWNAAVKVDLPPTDLAEPYTLSTYEPKSAHKRVCKKTDYVLSKVHKLKDLFEVKMASTTGVLLMREGDSFNVSWSQFLEEYYWIDVDREADLLAVYPCGIE